MWFRYRFRDRRINILLMALLIGVVVSLLSDKGSRFGGDSWIIWVILFAVIPMVSGRRSRSRRRRGYRSYRYDDYDEDDEDALEKPKNDFEKPKHEPRYMLGDDGEIVEASEDQPRVEDDYDDDKTLYI